MRLSKSACHVVLQSGASMGVFISRQPQIRKTGGRNPAGFFLYRFGRNLSILMVFAKIKLSRLLIYVT